MEPTLRRALEGDLAASRELLTACALPTQGLERSFPAGYVVARSGERLVGCAGVERHEADGLLRSVAVAADVRGGGLGERLVRDRIADARAQGLASLWLLTTTAAGFFGRLGFAVIGRVDAPEALRASDEFAHVCPAAAVCMRMAL